MNQPETRESPSRKEREKRVRQQEILKAARALFVTKGFHETTLDEVARSAEFGKGTLYHYFANKEDLFIGIIEQAIDETMLIARESMAAPGDLRDKLRLYARMIIQYTKENGELLHVLYHELHRSGTQKDSAKLRECIQRARGSWEILAEPFMKAVQAGTVRDFDPEQLAVLFDGLLTGYCFHRFTVERSSGDEDPSAAAELITAVFFDGIAEGKGKG
jgi:AcrR family transcriptional regulator